MRDMDPWKSLWQHVANADWVANTFIPLIMTAAGIVLAFLFFRHQLREDRKLHEAQLAAEKTRSTDSIRRQIASRYAAAAREHSTRIHGAGAAFYNDGDTDNWRRFFADLLSNYHKLSETTSILAATLVPPGATVATAEAIRENYFAMFIGIDDDALPTLVPDEVITTGIASRNRLRIAQILAHRAAEHLTLHANALDAWDGSLPNPAPSGVLAALDTPPTDVGSDEVERWNETAALPILEVMKRLRERDASRRRRIVTQLDTP